jgi:hypothetical protein
MILFPSFAEAIRKYPVNTARAMLGVRYSQIFEYRAGRKLPKAERLLMYSDLTEAAKQDVQARQAEAAAP